jgi:hypothetical protein
MASGLYSLYSYIHLFSLAYNNKFWKPCPAHILSYLPLFTGTATFVSEDPTASYAINSSLRLPEPRHRRISQACGAYRTDSTM